jgi:diguanylate cyclase (GGDEF)-like protein
MANKKLAGKFIKGPIRTISHVLVATGRIVKQFPLSQTLSLLVLALSLFFTYQLWQEAQSNTERVLQSDFESLVRESNRRIEQRMLTYEQVLRGAAGLFAASGTVSRRDFRAYVSTLRLDENYPGIQGVGFSVAVPPAHKENHIRLMRNEGFPQYTIFPEGTREIYTSIMYLEPFSGLNLSAFGYDMYSEPVRRTTMEQARDSAEPAISGKVILIQEAGRHIQNGFLMYFPVYRNGAARDTLAERRANLVGWIFAPFRMTDLMSGLKGEYPKNVDMEVYDGLEISDNTLMYDANKNVGSGQSGARFVNIQYIKVLGRNWTVLSKASPNFEKQNEYDKSPLILRTGIGASILLTLLAWLLIDERSRAWQVARQAYRLALYDVLTDLPNRKLFSDRLLHSLARAKRDKTQVAVMFIDLDKFKPVNDRFGHAVGDLLLKEVAKRLQECVRQSDTVARLGGDEFVVLIPYVQEKHGDMVVAEKILKAVAAPFEIAGHTLHISSSIGIAVYPEHGRDDISLLKNADTAMYHAKKSGRNNVKFFDATMLETHP